MLSQLNIAPGFQASTEFARINLEKKSRPHLRDGERAHFSPLIYGYKSIPVRVCNECPPRRNSGRREGGGASEGYAALQHACRCHMQQVLTQLLPPSTPPTRSSSFQHPLLVFSSQIFSYREGPIVSSKNRAPLSAFTSA